MSFSSPGTDALLAGWPTRNKACDVLAGRETGERCPRCHAEMSFFKASWHCTACTYKAGCC